MKIRIPSTQKGRAVLGAVIVVLALAGYAFWHAGHSNYAKIPGAINDKLLFTPYAVSKLPAGYHVDENSFSLQETTLIFTASNQSGQKIFFSEQSVPKNVDVDAFYGGALANPERLESSSFKTIFGKQRQGDGGIAGITTPDNTWILIAAPKEVTKDDVQNIQRGLVKQ